MVQYDTTNFEQNDLSIKCSLSYHTIIFSPQFPAHYIHHDVINWKHCPRYWPSVRGTHWLPVNSPHKGQWRGALMFSLSCAWINDWVNDCDTGDLRRHCAHYDVPVMYAIEIRRSKWIRTTHLSISTRVVNRLWCTGIVVSVALLSNVWVKWPLLNCHST